MHIAFHQKTTYSRYVTEIEGVPTPLLKSSVLLLFTYFRAGREGQAKVVANVVLRCEFDRSV